MILLLIIIMIIVMIIQMMIMMIMILIMIMTIIIMMLIMIIKSDPRISLTGRPRGTRPDKGAPVATLPRRRAAFAPSELTHAFVTYILRVPVYASVHCA